MGTLPTGPEPIRLTGGVLTCLLSLKGIGVEIPVGGKKVLRLFTNRAGSAYLDGLSLSIETGIGSS